MQWIHIIYKYAKFAAETFSIEVTLGFPAVKKGKINPNCQHLWCHLMSGSIAHFNCTLTTKRINLSTKTRPIPLILSLPRTRHKVFTSQPLSGVSQRDRGIKQFRGGCSHPRCSQNLSCQPSLRAKGKGVTEANWLFHCQSYFASIYCRRLQNFCPHLSRVHRSKTNPFHHPTCFEPPCPKQGKESLKLCLVLGCCVRCEGARCLVGTAQTAADS